MKNQNSTANTNFWKTLAIMFGIFILIAASILFIANSFAEDNDIAGKQIIVVQPQATESTADNSFDAVKDRVTEVNDNYGQNIKSSYAGSNSTMEAMAKQENNISLLDFSFPNIDSRIFKSKCRCQDVSIGVDKDLLL